MQDEHCNALQDKTKTCHIDIINISISISIGIRITVPCNALQNKTKRCHARIKVSASVALVSLYNLYLISLLIQFVSN